MKLTRTEKTIDCYRDHRGIYPPSVEAAAAIMGTAGLEDLMEAKREMASMVGVLEDDIRMEVRMNVLINL